MLGVKCLGFLGANCLTSVYVRLGTLWEGKNVWLGTGAERLVWLVYQLTSFTDYLPRFACSKLLYSQQVHAAQSTFMGLNPFYAWIFFSGFQIRSHLFELCTYNVTSWTIELKGARHFTRHNWYVASFSYHNSIRKTVAFRSKKKKV